MTKKIYNKKKGIHKVFYTLCIPFSLKKVKGNGRRKNEVSSHNRCRPTKFRKENAAGRRICNVPFIADVKYDT